MKIAQRKVVDALIAINRLSKQPMPSFTAYKLFRLKKKLKDVSDFQSEQEDKIIAELGGKVNERGVVTFDGDDKESKCAEFIKRQEELGNMECDMDDDRILIVLKEIHEISLSDMEVLDPFIEWKE